MAKITTTEEMINRFRDKHGDKFDYSDTNFTGVRNKLEIKCNRCGTKKLTLPGNHLKSSDGCTVCYNKDRINKEDFIVEAKKLHGDKFDYSLVEYKTNKTKICIICNTCSNIFYTNPNSHLRAKIGCLVCSNNNKFKTLSEFLEESQKIHGDKFEYIGGYDGCDSKVTFKCLVCEKLIIRTPSSHLNCGCRNCVVSEIGKSNKITIKDFEEECKIKHNNQYEYFQDYTYSTNNIKIKCNKCNNIFFQCAGEHKTKLSGCPICSFDYFSKGEYCIALWLKTNCIYFQSEKTFPDCRHKDLLRFDFYIESYNTLIEYDGPQHFSPCDWFGGEEVFKNTKIRDNIKDEYCIQKGINLIRIPYTDFKNIGKILEKEILNKGDIYV